jgi:hypothetical protein
VGAVLSDAAGLVYWLVDLLPTSSARTREESQPTDVSLRSGTTPSRTNVTKRPGSRGRLAIAFKPLRTSEGGWRRAHPVAGAGSDRDPCVRKAGDEKRGEERVST